MFYRFFNVDILGEAEAGFTEPKSSWDYGFYIFLLLGGMGATLWSATQITSFSGIVNLIVGVLLAITFALWIFGDRIFKSSAVTVFFIYRLLFLGSSVVLALWGYFTNSLNLISTALLIGEKRA